MEYKGSCLCKRIKFIIHGTFEKFYLCHCRYCRKDTGSAHAANLFSKTAVIKWVKLEAKIKTFSPPKSQHTKSFCTHCGGPVPNFQENGNLLMVPAGCLDTKISIIPDAHIFVSNKAEWDHDFEKIQCFESFPV